MTSPVSEMTSSLSRQVGKIAKAEDLKEENKELLEKTKQKQSVKNVLQQIKEMEAAEEAKKWKPPSKNRGDVPSSTSGSNYVNVSSSAPAYVNEIKCPKLPERTPPKITANKSTDKKNKKEEKSKLFSVEKENSDIQEDFYEEIPSDEKYVEPISHSGHRPPSGEYEVPDETAPPPPRTTCKNDKPKRRVSVQPSINTENIEEMTIEEVAQLLKLLGLDKHSKTFKKNKVSGVLLKQMDNQVLKKEFKFTQFEALKLTEFLDSGHIPE